MSSDDASPKVATEDAKGFSKFYDKNIAPLPFPVRCAFNAVCLFALLYLFLLGLNLMGDAFKGMSGKGVGDMLSGVSNPVAGVSMVGANIINVYNAIPMIMGANIGTSVTNTIV